MKRVLIAVVVLILLTAACWSRVLADDQPADAAKPSVTATDESRKALTDDEKRKLEIEARKKAEGGGSSESGSTVPEKHDENYTKTWDTQAPPPTNVTPSTDTSKDSGASTTYTPPTAISSQGMVDKSSTSAPSTTTATATGAATSTPQTREEKEAAEYKARREAEKKQRVEVYRRANDYVIVPTSDAYYTRAQRSHPEPQHSSVSLVYAPGTSTKDPAYGIQWFSPQRYGLAVWGSGDLVEDDDVIDAMIPHDDYYMTERKGSYSIEALYSMGSPDSVLTIGAGACIDEVERMAVSNVTGWKWDAGTEHTTKFAAQLGIRLRVAGTVSVQYGYDTVQRNFFGLTAEF